MFRLNIVQTNTFNNEIPMFCKNKHNYVKTNYIGVSLLLNRCKLIMMKTNLKLTTKKSDVQPLWLSYTLQI
jgi:hypothetical protein